MNQTETQYLFISISYSFQNHLQSNNEEEFNDEYLSDHNYDNEADKNRIVEQSPRGRFLRVKWF